MPGPGPRGPRQTYRAPCSSILDSLISARNPRKTGESRAARGTRTLQSTTSSTRDGFPQLDFDVQPPDLGPRSSSSSPAIEALGPGIRSPGLDSCKFVPAARQLELALKSYFRGPGISGHFASKNNHLPRFLGRGPGCVPAGAWAMFLTNNPVKNDMTVSRETLPNY